jgi:PglZ domain
LLGGDELAALSAAYKNLASAVRERREKLNGLFAEALRIWNAEGSSTAGCVPVERILEETVAPLAQHSHVLLLVLDGLSFPIFRELSVDLQRLGWTEAVPDDAARADVAIAALPTVTEISRTSLLCGRLASGAANVEKSGFGTYPALLAASKAAGKPIVFHKGELGDTMGLSQEVREAVGTRDRRIVAVVYNAVDDHLSGSDQLHLRWSLDDLRLLKPLLYEAQTAGRALVITADHGHVIDEKTVQRSGTDGDRWRTHSGAVEQGEIALEGGRVQTPSGANKVVCAWSEQLRYSSKKNGYHGGVAPQEVVVPLNVFLPSRIEIEGWRSAAPEQPDWWEDLHGSEARPPAPVRPLDVKPKKPAAKGQAELFEGVEPQAKRDWIVMLFDASTYQQQKQLAARVAPADQDMRRLLEALDGRGGKLSKAALAQRLGLPLVRLSGFVNAARRVLNIDQSGILSLDETNAVVELNRELLEIQFQLKSH